MTEEKWLRIWAFGTSPTGLGLSSSDLWSLSPREYQALRDQWKESRMETVTLFAELQATLHNAHFTHPEKKQWTREMFLPGYKASPKPTQSWQLQKAMAQAITRQITDQDRETMKADAKVMAERVARAKQAQELGHTPEFVRSIMEGLDG